VVGFISHKSPGNNDCCWWVSADLGVKSLVNVKSQCVGEKGMRGLGKHCHGSNADDTVVQASVSVCRACLYEAVCLISYIAQLTLCNN